MKLRYGVSFVSLYCDLQYLMAKLALGEKHSFGLKQLFELLMNNAWMQ